MPTARIKEMEKEHVPKYFTGDEFIKPVYLSILRSRYYTQSWKETEGQPTSIRRAKAVANYLDNVPIFIRPFELIVGYPEEDAHAMPFTIESINPQVAENYIQAGYCKEEDKDEWRELIEYWRPRSLPGIMKHYVSEQEWRIAAARNRYIEVLPGEYTSRTQPDHDTYLNCGLKGILAILRQKLNTLERQWKQSIGGTKAVEMVNKIADVKAMIIAAEAVIRWSKRYSTLAKKMVKKEKDPERKKALEQIAEICAWVPANPARSFWEAMQSHWFMFLVYHFVEVLCHGTSLRLDQVFWPWYEKDVLIEKTLPRERALELMEEFLLHVDELGRPLPVHRRRALQGVNLLGTYTIGGVRPEDGSDACSDLTTLILDALDDLRLSHPDFKFRWHPKVNPKVWRRVVEVIHSGLGQPSVKNDQVVIDGLMNHYGFTLEEARSWAVVGCISPAPTIGSGRCRRDAWSARPAKALEMALNNGVDPVLGHETPEFQDDPLFKALAKNPQLGPKTGDATTFTSFEQVQEALRKQFRWQMQLSASLKTISEHLNNMYLKRPFSSCIYHRSLDACRDIMDVPEKGMPWVNDVGIVDTVDSLVALKKLVFDEKKYTIQEVVEVLRANWEGYDDMRQEFIDAPKYGNDDDYADTIATWTYSMVAEEMSKVKDVNNASPMPSGLVVSRMFQGAPHTGALPNGRKLNDPLADGGISPHPGYDRSGPMAGILSAAKIDARKQKANIYNQKLTPASVEGENGLKKFQNYIEASMDLGLDMIQFNITDAKILRAAQEKPEQYANLVVRVSGYNARFVELNKFVQDSIIERTQHELK